MATVMTAGIPTPPPSVDMDKSPETKLNLWEKLRLTRWLSREDSPPPADCLGEEQTPSKPRFGRRLSRKVVPGLPRPGTFRRQNSERRHNLQPHRPCPQERRATSTGRQRALSERPASPPPLPKAQTLPEERDLNDYLSPIRRNAARYPGQGDNIEPFDTLPDSHPRTQRPPSPPPAPSLEPIVTDGERPPSETSAADHVDDELKEELDRKWILNLSMHFRDHSPREKFFLTYAETPQKWRRLTVSCDYRDVPEDSLEYDLQQLSFQRDKSARIYESIRMSLPDIQFYDTVTNLKLETIDDRLHVHVTEDVNEIINYPHAHAVQHIDCPRYLESELHFESHMSGFVYKVSVRGNTWIKKEIPGPDSVDEFLYEINALTELTGSTNVIELKGLVVNTEKTLVKGLLIGFAEQGALVDILYDDKGHLPWSKRAQWAKQIVCGLSEIHEAGFVQGDFTLSNIVVNEDDEAQIIDINRRGCPVGWEPPEIAKLIDSGQRISMYIGVKSDLFQLGMVLWGIAEEEDEPERRPRPLSLADAKEEIPTWYRDLTHKCLSERPKDRTTAKELLALFPEDIDSTVRKPEREESGNGVLDSRLLERFPHLNVSDLQGPRSASSNPNRHSSSRDVDIPFDDEGSCMVRRRHGDDCDEQEERRGRTPPANISHLNLNDYFQHPTRIPGRSQADRIGEVDEDEDRSAGDHNPQIIPVSPGGDNRWDEVEFDGTPYLVSRDGFIERQHQPEESNSLTHPIEHINTQTAHNSNTPPLNPHTDLPSHTHVSQPPPAPSALSNALNHRFQHVDSGLADMDQDLVGVGGNDNLGASPTDPHPYDFTLDGTHLEKPNLNFGDADDTGSREHVNNEEKDHQKTLVDPVVSGLSTIEESKPLPIDDGGAKEQVGG